MGSLTEEMVAKEGDLRCVSLCSQSCSGARGAITAQALITSPERKASICLSEGNVYLSNSGRAQG